MLLKEDLTWIFLGADIAYFLRLPLHVPDLRYKAFGKRPKAKRYIKSFSRHGMLTYRLASQIYEAKDCDFRKSEITELLDKDEMIVGYALFYRKEVKPKIVKGLRVLYAECNVNTSYITPEMLVKLEKEDKR